MKKIIAGFVFLLCSLPVFAQIPATPTCVVPDSKCWLQGAFLAGAPTSPTTAISVSTVAPWWIGVVPYSWYEYYGVYEYQNAVHLSVSGFAGMVLVRQGRTGVWTLEVADVPAPPVLYQTTWNPGNNTITSLDALVPITWVKSTTTTTIGGVQYTYNTWTYDGPLDAQIATNLEPQIAFALQTTCQAVKGPASCSYKGYQYTQLVPLPSSGGDD